MKPLSCVLEAFPATSSSIYNFTRERMSVVYLRIYKIAYLSLRNVVSKYKNQSFTRSITTNCVNNKHTFVCRKTSIKGAKGDSKT